MFFSYAIHKYNFSPKILTEKQLKELSNKLTHNCVMTTLFNSNPTIFAVYLFPQYLSYDNIKTGPEMPFSREW